MMEHIENWKGKILVEVVERLLCIFLNGNLKRQDKEMKLLLTLIATV
jgi:hypothetical protein